MLVHRIILSQPGKGLAWKGALQAWSIFGSQEAKNMRQTAVAHDRLGTNAGLDRLQVIEGQRRAILLALLQVAMSIGFFVVRALVVFIGKLLVVVMCLLHKNQALSSFPAIISPMGMAEVAAGEGALQTCSIRAVCRNRKS